MEQDVDLELLREREDAIKKLEVITGCSFALAVSLGVIFVGFLVVFGF